MPIINGTFVPDSLPQSKDAQKQVFSGQYSSRDMSDYSAAAYNYLMQQQAQAYNLDLWRLQNEYNSPEAQMLRYQQAGLNPNLIYGQQNVAQSPASASPPSFRSSGASSKSFAQAMNMIGEFTGIIKAARDTYDYMKFGAAGHKLQNTTEFMRGALARYQSEGARLEYLWNNYLLGSPDAEDYSGTPRGIMYRAQYDAQQAKIQQLKAAASLIPDQILRIKALKALDDKRLQILQGQNDFLIDFNTGHPDFDKFFKMFAYFVLNSGT